MTPYYDEDGITIYHADCRDVLLSVAADVVLTDLPYAVNLDYGDEMTDSPEYLTDLITTALPLMRSAAPVVALTSGIGNWWRYPEPTWVLCWHTPTAHSSTGRWGFNNWQPILVYGTDPFLRRGLGRRPDVIVTTTANTHNPFDHPCPKPLASWRKVLLRVSPAESDVILDPLMGSGTTLRAAKDLGRRAIGIDTSERYCEIAAKRLAQGVLDFGLEFETIVAANLEATP